MSDRVYTASWLTGHKNDPSTLVDYGSYSWCPMREVLAVGARCAVTHRECYEKTDPDCPLQYGPIQVGLRKYASEPPPGSGVNDDDSSEVAS